MFRDVAVSRIKQGLGFLSSSSYDDTIVLALQEAQRELEKGKTLPKFLIEEDVVLSAVANVPTINLPSGFIRPVDGDDLRYTPAGETTTEYLQRKLSLSDALIAYENSTLEFPRVYVLRKATLYLVPTPTVAISFRWSYYKQAALLTTNIENVWLTNEPDWLIGEAGYRMALDMRNSDAITSFDAMRKTARDSHFRELVTAETAGALPVLGEGY